MSKATEELKALAADIDQQHMASRLTNLVNAVLAELEQAMKDRELAVKLDEAKELLRDTKSMVMRIDDNREWLERRNRLLGWPPLQKYDS